MVQENIENKSDDVVDGNSSSNNSESKTDRQETSNAQKRSFSKKTFSAEFMFFLFKVAEGILEPSIRMYLYDSVCLNLFADSDYNHICSNLSSDLDKEILVQEMTATYMAHYKVWLHFMREHCLFVRKERFSEAWRPLIFKIDVAMHLQTI